MHSLDVVAGPFPSFSDYREHMQGDTHWGDHLVLTAISHLLLRPIRTISDAALGSNAVKVVQPLESIAEDAWGEPVYLAYHQDVHYEGTTPVEGAAEIHELSDDGEVSEGGGVGAQDL